MRWEKRPLVQFRIWLNRLRLWSQWHHNKPYTLYFVIRFVERIRFLKHIVEQQLVYDNLFVPLQWCEVDAEPINELSSTKSQLTSDWNVEDAKKIDGGNTANTHAHICRKWYGLCPMSHLLWMHWSEFRQCWPYSMRNMFTTYTCTENKHISKSKTTKTTSTNFLVNVLRAWNGLISLMTKLNGHIIPMGAEEKKNIWPNNQIVVFAIR